jgi:hypothetical protein
MLIAVKFTFLVAFWLLAGESWVAASESLAQDRISLLTTLVLSSSEATLN